METLFRTALPLKEPPQRPFKSKAAHQTVAPSQLFCFGLGYVGQGLAHFLRNQGWKVSGTCRRKEQADWLRRFDINAVILDESNLQDRKSANVHPELVDALAVAPYVLNTIPPLRTDSHSVDMVLEMLGDDAVELLRHVEWIGNLSVFGDWNGDWVNEKSETKTQSSRGKLRLKAESEWMSLFDAGLPVHTFRLGGVYGPGRSLLDHLDSGNVSRRRKQRFTNRCHVYDICQVLYQSMLSPRPGEVYCVADDCPMSRADASQSAEEMLQCIGKDLIVDPTKFVFKSKPRQKKGAENLREDKPESKRACNEKIKTDLGVSLEFPNVRDGLHAICTGDTRPFVSLD